MLLLYIALSSESVLADIAVIVNSKNTTNRIELNHLQDIYLGKLDAFSDGSMAIPIDQVKLRSDFYEKLTHRPIEQINAYWSRIMFSGEASPPKILTDDASVISIVKDNPGAIGYITKENVTKEVKIILLLK